MTAMERIAELEKRLQDLSDRIVLLEAKDARRVEGWVDARASAGADWVNFAYADRTRPIVESDYS